MTGIFILVVNKCKEKGMKERPTGDVVCRQCLLSSDGQFPFCSFTVGNGCSRTMSRKMRTKENPWALLAVLWIKQLDCPVTLTCVR